MDAERIQQIRAFGDELATYIVGQNDRRFFRSFYTETRYDYLRNSIIKASMSQVKAGNPPLINLDDYLGVFEESDELVRVNWRLARDLVLIRLIEQLYTKGWFEKNTDAFPEIEDAEISE